MAGKPLVDLYVLLDDIRTRPAMFIGSHSIRLMRAFIEGMLYLDRLGVVEVRSDPDFGGFHEWVRAKYGFRESTSGWCNMLLSRSVVASGWEVAEGTALDRFFDDLAEFRSGTQPPLG